LGLSSGLLHSGFPTTFLRAFDVSYMLHDCRSFLH
jgi:hypothetical protein